MVANRRRHTRVKGGYVSIGHAPDPAAMSADSFVMPSTIDGISIYLRWDVRQIICSVVEADLQVRLRESCEEHSQLGRRGGPSGPPGRIARGALSTRSQRRTFRPAWENRARSTLNSDVEADLQVRLGESREEHSQLGCRGGPSGPAGRITRGASQLGRRGGPSGPPGRITRGALSTRS